ncbi:MAG: hypothetical protein IJH37_02315 [Clostridia bacterium]|nr:hypothetical protein [Clostridia bacterium]
MKKFFTIVIAVVMVAMGWYIISYFLRPVNSIKLEKYTQEALISCESALIVRNEMVFYSTSAGKVYNNAKDGERVSKNEIISSVFSKDVDESYLKKLRSIDDSIDRLEKRMSTGAYGMDKYTAENDISSGLNSVVSLAEGNDVGAIQVIKEDINSYRSGAQISPEEKKTELEIERENIENILKSHRSDIISVGSGIFSSYVDGLEAVLMPERAEDYTVQYVRSLIPGELSKREGETVITGDPICKIMNNHIWYVLGITDEANSDLCKEGKAVKLRFPGITSSEIGGTITYISEPDENGEYIFFVKVPTYLESAFSYRKVKTDFIFDRYEGYKIPLDAIHTREGINEYYVNAMKGSKQYECDCEILFTDNGKEYAIIDSTDTAEYKLSAMDRLVVGER